MACSHSTLPSAALVKQAEDLSRRVDPGRRPRRSTIQALGLLAYRLALLVRELEADNAALRQEVERHRAASEAALDAWLLELDQQ